MAELHYEFAVFGSTPLAGLVAGLLASVHGRRVCLVAGANAPFRLPTGLDLSVMPVTRPQTWALLSQGTRETLALLARFGARAAVRRVDPLFLAATGEAGDALAHLRHMAPGFGVAVEATAPGPAGGAGLRLRDAVLLDRWRLEAALAAWLARCGVPRLAAPRGAAAFRRGGGVRIGGAGPPAEADHAVLADDEAIGAAGEAGAPGPPLLRRTATAILATTARPLAEPVALHVDRQVRLARLRNGAILALGPGPARQAVPAIRDCLAAGAPLQQGGRRVFEEVVTTDGAPLVGPLAAGGPTVIAGFGPGAAFFAPALARHLAGAASAMEADYFAARQAGDAGARGAVADFVPAAWPEAAA